MTTYMIQACDNPGMKYMTKRLFHWLPRPHTELSGDAPSACYPSRSCMLSRAELHAIPGRAEPTIEPIQIIASPYLYQRGGNRPRFDGCDVWGIPFTPLWGVYASSKLPQSGYYHMLIGKTPGSPSSKLLMARHPRMMVNRQWPLTLLV